MTRKRVIQNANDLIDAQVGREGAGWYCKILFMHFHSCCGVAEFLRQYFCNNPILLLPYLGYIGDIIVSSMTSPGMNAILANHVPDSDGTF